MHFRVLLSALVSLFLLLPAYSQTKAPKSPSAEQIAACEKVSKQKKDAAFSADNPAATVIGVGGGLIGGLIAVGIRQNAADAAAKEAYSDCFTQKGLRVPNDASQNQGPATRFADSPTSGPSSKAISPPPRPKEPQACPKLKNYCSGALEQCGEWCDRYKRGDLCHQFCKTVASDCMKTGLWKDRYCIRSNMQRR